MKVLIADDHRLIVEGVKRALEEAPDFEVGEQYLVSAFDTEDESRHLTEVCWPVFQTMPPD